MADFTDPITQSALGGSKTKILGLFRSGIRKKCFFSLQNNRMFQKEFPGIGGLIIV